jgi:hypothetical protein
MGCNCKNPSVDTEELEVKKTNKVKIGNTILNFILFLVLTCIVIPFVIPFIIYVLFKTIVLKNNNNNLIPMLLKVSKKIIGNEDEGKTDEDYQVYENNEYELMDVESVNN